MPEGDKSRYTDKQKRKAEHIEDSYRKRGVSKGQAEERAWRTVNKQDGGAKKKSEKSASRSKSSRSSPRKKTSGGKRSSGRKAAARRRF